MQRFLRPARYTWSLTSLISLTLVVVPLGFSSARGDKQLDTDVQRVIAQAAASTVRIRIVGSSEDSSQAVTSQTTTGVVLTKSGLIISSAFGFGSKPTAVLVEDADGERVAARRLATDYVRKLVLLQAESGTFQPARFSQRRWPVVGEYAIAAGRLYPGKLPSVSVGIISAVKRIHELAFQTDAKISPVNYGGPVMNLDGEVTGILVPLSPRESGPGINAGVEWYDSGIGFAVPAADLPEIVRTLKTGRDRTRGFLGIRPATENPLSSDVRITTVLPDSPAETGGLKTDDRIVAINDIPITRYGEFQSIVKRAYAGDRLTFQLKRGGKQVETEITLADKLVAPAAGYLGVIVGDAVTDGDQKSVRAHLLPGAPLARQTDLQKLNILRWNETDVTSALRLDRMLRGLLKDKTVQIRHQPEGSEQTLTIDAIPDGRSSQLPNVDQEFVRTALGTDSETEWNTFVEDIGEDGSLVWGYAPTDVKTPATGVVVLLGDATTPREAVRNQWQDVCRLHNLMIVVPVNDEKTPLSREDRALVTEAFRKAVFGRALDSRRICLVADQQSAELATEILLNPESRIFTSAAYIRTWPRTTGIPAQVISEKPPSLLILNGIVQSRTAQALRAQAISRVSEGGGTVVQSAAEGGPTIQESIALWCLTLKAR
ncbi:MAG: S1C family serine protease [Planctomycetaceae bacterium]|nr:S1C family serine protease [Planctomycetaceae bacterium]